MADIPNFYDPNAAANTVIGGLDRLGQTAGQIAQPYIQTQQKQREMEMATQHAHAPSSISIEDLQNVRNALDNGADPQELGTRYSMKNAGMIPHVAHGLSPDHPISQSHPQPGQVGQPGQPDQGTPMQPGGPGQPMLGAAMPEPQKHYLTNEQAEFMLKGGRSILGETPAEKAQREYYKTLIQQTGQAPPGALPPGTPGAAPVKTTKERVAETTEAGKNARSEASNKSKEKISGQTNATRENTATIRGKYSLAAALARAQATISAHSGSADPEVKKRLDEVKSINSYLGKVQGTPGAESASPTAAGQVQSKLQRLDQLTKELDQLKARAPSTSSGATVKLPAMMGGLPGSKAGEVPQAVSIDDWLNSIGKK